MFLGITRLTSVFYMDVLMDVVDVVDVLGIWVDVVDVFILFWCSLS